MSHYFEYDKDVKSNRKIIKVKFNNNLYSFFTDNGVFSKSGLDFGTRTLLENIDILKLSGEVLDIGCGYGPIGIILSQNPNIVVTMSDINERALDLAKENIRLNGCKNISVITSDVYSDINKKYDYIITNPPIRVGNEILHKFLFLAKDYLKKDGKFYFVVNKNQGAKSLIKKMQEIYNVEVIGKNKGFFIFCCKVIDNLY